MSLLIIGKLPLPIGGVTIHVKRLLDLLRNEHISFSFYDLSKFTFLTFCKQIKKHDVVHLHSSSPFLHILFCLMCKWYMKESIITFHGDLGRFGKLKNILELIAVHMVSYPIVLNQKSFIIARKYNSKVILMSAYIPSIIDEKLDEQLQNKLANFRLAYNFIVSTNAYNFSLDNNNKEIYGITELINFFSQHNKYGLIVSDPSGNYKKRFPLLSSNILILDSPHPFYKVLDYVDCFIRYTSTDGDSLSIHESLEHGVTVIATDVVNRPKGVHLVRRGDIKELEFEIESLARNNNSSNRQKREYSGNCILSFYQQIL